MKFFLSLLGRYVWEESHKEANYTNWASGEPHPTGDCIGKVIDTFSGCLPGIGWYDSFCDRQEGSCGGTTHQIHALCELQIQIE